MAQKWFKKASVQTAIVSGVFFLIGVFIPYFLKVPALEREVLRLKQESSEKSNEIQRLETQLVPFRSIALERYPGVEAEALKKLADHLNEIESDLSALKDYGEVATWTFMGNKSLYGIEVGSPVSGWTKNFIVDKDGTMTIKCDVEAIDYYKKMIVKHPRYPFPLYPLSLCLKIQGDKDWQQYANKAVSILNKTRIVPGHDNSHDDVLQKFMELLKD